MRLIILPAALLFFSLVASAKGFSPFELLTPNPVEGENIQIYYYGCDTPVANLFTDEFFYTEQNGNEINLVVSMGPGLPLCNIQYEYYYDLGQLSEGSYQIEVYVTTGTTPYPINLNEWIATDTFDINVQGIQSTATPVPSMNLLGLILLFLLTVGLTAVIAKTRGVS